MSHEHAPEYFARYETVQRITPDDLHASPPRVAASGQFVGRVDSGGLGGPRWFVGEYRDARMPSAIVLEYGAPSGGRRPSARVWGLVDPRRATADYRLVHDDSSRGYVTV